MFLSKNKKNNVYPCKLQFYYITRGPQATTHLSETATADMQMTCNIFPILLWQGLNSFWDILLTRLKCWNFQNAVSKKKLDIFQKSFGSSTYPVL